MGEKKGKGEDGDKEKKKETATAEESGITVVLKIEMHCEGCATKILKAVKTIQGVERAKADWESNKLTVKGELEAEELREELQEKLGKKVELISPKKDKDSGGGGGDSKKHDAKKDNNSKKDDGKSSGKDSNKSNEKKPKEKDKGKEAPVTTAVLKLRFHCTGCIVKIHKIVSKTPGVEDVAIDKAKELVTVTGTMDVKALAQSLQEKMKTSVNVVTPKKEKDDSGGDGKKNKKGAGGEDNAEAGGGGGGMIEGNRMEYVGLPMPNYGPAGYGPGIMYGDAAGSMPGFGYALYNPNPYANGNNLHAPQIFSDENPNACSIM